MQHCIRRLKERSFKVRITAVYAKPCKRIKDSLGPLRIISRVIGIFYPQNENAISLQRKNPVV
jgi:hypothetical protein